MCYLYHVARSISISLSRSTKGGTVTFMYKDLPTVLGMFRLFVDSTYLFGRCVTRITRN